MSDFDPLAALLADNAPTDALGLRAMLDGFAAEFLNNDLPTIGQSIDDVLIEQHSGQDLTVDIHRPAGEGPFPVLMYLHGGGWIMGSPKTHRRLGFRFAEAGYLTFNVHYRLAPESPFPAAFDDAVTALEWVHGNAPSYGGDAARLAVGGDSAGGNLTAALSASLEARDLIKAILLIYPALDFADMKADLLDVSGESDLADMMAAAYIGHDRDNLERDPRVSPIHAAERLHPAYVVCGTADPLIDGCRELVSRLEAADILHEMVVYDDMPHGFVQMEEMFPQARQSIDGMLEFLRRTLRT